MARYPKMEYDQEVADRICEMILDGNTIRDICATEGIPSVAVLFRWLREEKEFEKQYARAKEMQAEAFISEMNEIADDGRNDWMEKKLRDGSTIEVVNHEHIQRSKLRIDTRKWLASKYMPKKYGERMTLAGDPEAPLSSEGLSDNDRAAMARVLKNYPDRVADIQQAADETEEHDDIC